MLPWGKHDSGRLLAILASKNAGTSWPPKARDHQNVSSHSRHVHPSLYSFIICIQCKSLCSYEIHWCICWHTAQPVPTPTIPKLVESERHSDSLTVEVEVPEGLTGLVEYAEHAIFAYSWKPVPGIHDGRVKLTGLKPATRYTVRLSLTNGQKMTTSQGSPWFTTLSEEEEEQKARQDTHEMKFDAIPPMESKVAPVLSNTSPDGDDEPPVDETGFSFDVVERPASPHAPIDPGPSPTGAILIETQQKAEQLSSKLAEADLGSTQDPERMRRELEQCVVDLTGLTHWQP